jgi:hypothetical protein
MMVSGTPNAFEPPHHEDVDEDEHRREGQTQVAEDLVGDVPLAVPFHRVLRRVERLAGVVDLERDPSGSVSCETISFIRRMA